MSTEEKLSSMRHIQDAILHTVEVILATFVLAGVVYAAANLFQGFFQKDWSDILTVYEFISVVLVILLGIEVARLILVHSITIVMELMLLIISRKMLSPSIEALDMLYCVIAFSLTVGVYYFYQLKPIKSLEDLTR